MLAPKACMKHALHIARHCPTCILHTQPQPLDTLGSGERKLGLPELQPISASPSSNCPKQACSPFRACRQNNATKDALNKCCGQRMGWPRVTPSCAPRQWHGEAES